MIKNLDNNEISCVYYQFKKHYEELNETLANKCRVEQEDVNTGDVTLKALFVVSISDEEVAAIKSSHYYQTVKSILDKLAPVVELIEEVEPNIKTDLEQ